MDLNLLTTISFTILGTALLVGGIIVPYIYTIRPIAISSGCWPMNLVWRLIFKTLFLILIMKDAYIHYTVYTANHMPARESYTSLDFIVIIGTLISLAFTWITHPDGIKSV